MRLAGAAAALREVHGAVLSPSWRRIVDRWLEVSRAALGDKAATAAWQTGKEMPMEAAIGYALGPSAATKSGAPPAREPGPVRATDALTRREREVAELIAQGLSNRQIAERLVITDRTVAAHVEHILDKLAFSSRTQIGIWAAEHHLVASGSA
jgi:non-specific serine/threonine protein kinase